MESVGVKSVITDKYLRPMKDARLSANGRGNPQMYLEKARAGNDMYHIKSRETNKYWQVKSAGDLWITADADVINEDQRSLACTMFHVNCFATSATDPVGKTARLRHGNLQRYACAFKDGDDYYLRAVSDSTDNDSKDVFVCEKF
ncbi:unnamed protein product [Camellia sinensis]